MKEYEIKELTHEKVVLKSVKCDRCGSECKNTYFDIAAKASFCETYDFIEVICYNCYEKLFKQKIIDNKDKHIEDRMKLYANVEESE